VKLQQKGKKIQSKEKKIGDEFFYKKKRKEKKGPDTTDQP
jgi:coproporphyrinogen III oxidase